PDDLIERLMKTKLHIGREAQKFNDKYQRGWSSQTKPAKREDGIVWAAQKAAQSAIGPLQSGIRLIGAQVFTRLRPAIEQERWEKNARHQYDAMIDALDDGVMGAQSPDIPFFQNTTELLRFLCSQTINGITGWVRKSVVGTTKKD